MKQKFKGDLVFVVDNFLFRDEIAIMDVYLTNPDTGEPKAFTIKNGVLLFPGQHGYIVMGELLLVAYPQADILAALGDRVKGRKVVIIPAK